MKRIDEYKWTNNKSVYNKLHKFYNAGCTYCAWNKGCNSNNRRNWGKLANWKKQRKTQWIEK